MRSSPALAAVAVLFFASARADEAEVLAATDVFVRARDDALARLVVLDDVAAALADLDAAAAALTTRLGGDDPVVERARLVVADALLAAGRALGPGAERDARLARALAAYEAHVDEAPAGPALLLHAYVQRAEALLALDRADEAARAAEELTWVHRPSDPADPAERAALDALVLDVCLRAFHLQARALLAAGRPAEALQALTQVAARPAARGVERHALAKALEVERARALHGVGRGAEAAAALAAVIAAGRAAPAGEHLEGLGLDRAGALACRTLADLDLAGGLPLDDPAVAFDAGLGHLLAGRKAPALAAWRRVLVVARAAEARARWVPSAAERAGRLLLQEERWLEAALTFEALLVLAPEAAPPEAARLALLAATRATRQLGEELTGDGPAARLRRRVEEVVARSPVGAEAEAAGALELALALEREGRWRDAARAYLRVPEGAGARGRALVRAGECLLRAGDAGEARRCLAEALEAAAGHPGLAEERARASCALAELELAHGDARAALQRLVDARAALERLAGAGAGPGLVVRAAAARARAHLALDDVQAALAAFREVAAAHDDPRHGPLAVELTAALRARAAARLGADVVETSAAEEARGLLGAAAEVVAAWAARDGQAPDALRPDQALWAGRALLEGGRPAAAAPLLRGALARAPREASDEAVRARLRAEVDLGLALALGDDPRAGREALAACRDAVVVRDGRGRVVGEGRLVERRLAGPFEARVEGRLVARHAWVTTVRGADGVARAYIDVAPAEGEARFHVVEGDRPPAGRVPEAERTLTLEGRRDPRVVLGLERATWAVWAREGDRRLLATAGLPDVGAARALLAGQRPGGWRRLAAPLPGEPLDLDLRRWDADLRLLEVKLALERWDEVASDLHLRALLGGPPVPPAFEERLAAIRRAAEERR